MVSLCERYQGTCGWKLESVMCRVKLVLKNSTKHTGSAFTVVAPLALLTVCAVVWLLLCFSAGPGLHVAHTSKVYHVPTCNKVSPSFVPNNYMWKQS